LRDTHTKYYHFSFFFSSRRRHTRSTRDWSSDVCSSDLGTRNGCGRIGLGHFVDQPLGLPSAPAVAEKMEHIHQPGAGNDSLITHVAKTRAQIAEQIEFQVIARREISMSTLAGEDMMLQTIPVHTGFAQSSSGCDYRLIANGTSFHLVQTNDVFRIKRRNTPGIRFQVIDEQCLTKLQFVGKPLGFDCPREIERFHTSIAYWTGDSKAGG